MQTCLCMGVRAVVTVAPHSFFTDHCLLSPALTLSVSCRPMPMVSSVDQVAAYQVCSHPASVCLVDHVLHGDCPDVMTLGSQRRTVAYYTRGEGQARCYEARCVFPPWGQASPQLGPLTGPDPWGSGAGSWGSATRVSRVRSVRAWGPSTGPTACALAGRRCSLWGWRKGVPGGGAFHRCEGRLRSGAPPPPTASS